MPIDYKNINVELADNRTKHLSLSLAEWFDIRAAQKLLFETIGLENQYILTGSNVYGTPTDKSDVDVVLLLTEEVYNILKEYADKKPDSNESEYDYEFPTLRFGKLNLICCSDLTAFKAWKEGTDTLAAKKPVTREEAKQLFQTLRMKSPQ